MPDSAFKRWIAAAFAASLFLAGCGEMRPIGERSDLIVYTVKPGDTLYSVSWRYGYDPREIAAWNTISHPYTIYVGQRLMIIPPYQTAPREPPAPTGTTYPQGSSGTAAAVSQGAVISRTPLPVATKPDTTPSAAVTSRVDTSGLSRHSDNIDWRWPTKGMLRSSFGPSAGKKGVDIAGTLGQPVFAAAAGKVVYSGNGLIGYGNLVIIKHDAHYLSAYGHNRRLLVKEGSEVKQGEKIAEMGDSGKDGVVLHFEIRRDGKPVDPLHYLPKQGT